MSTNALGWYSPSGFVAEKEGSGPWCLGRSADSSSSSSAWQKLVKNPLKNQDMLHQLSSFTSLAA